MKTIADVRTYLYTCVARHHRVPIGMVTDETRLGVEASNEIAATLAYSLNRMIMIESTDMTIGEFLQRLTAGENPLSRE